MAFFPFDPQLLTHVREADPDSRPLLTAERSGHRMIRERAEVYSGLSRMVNRSGGTGSGVLVADRVGRPSEVLVTERNCQFLRVGRPGTVSASFQRRDECNA